MHSGNLIHPERLWFILALSFLYLLVALAPAHAAEPLPGPWPGSVDVRLGGLLQGDYRYYFEDERTDNRFDIRRSRLIAEGRIADLLRFELEYELQDNEAANLLDAYIATDFGEHSLVAGQFKEPYSLEWQSPNHPLYFAERSMGYYLTPNRDIGVMLTGSLFDGLALYSAGLFNGNGIGGEIRRKQHDDPEIAGRIVFQPLRNFDNFLRTVQVGASGTYARIDTPNIDTKVKGTGMAGSTRSLYVLTHDTKFGVINDVDRRDRLSAEAAWTYGPLAVFGEYFTLAYRDLVPVGGVPLDAELSAWYTAAVFSITGEPVLIENGRILPLVPARPFSPARQAYGALCIAGRVEHFDGDEDWINPAAFVSVRDADAYSIAADWILSREFRVLLDYTHTRLSDPIRVRVLPDGTVDYISKENVLTLRFSLDF